jgi:hypothetical protein
MFISLFIIDFLRCTHCATFIILHQSPHHFLLTLSFSPSITEHSIEFVHIIPKELVSVIMCFISIILIDLFSHTLSFSYNSLPITISVSLNSLSLSLVLLLSPNIQMDRFISYQRNCFSVSLNSLSLSLVLLLSPTSPRNCSLSQTVDFRILILK